MEIKQQSAYYECGKAVFAYINGFKCKSLEISEEDPARGKTVLFSAQEGEMATKIFNGDSASLTEEGKKKALLLSNRLLAIHAAGTCSSIFFKNGKAIPSEPEIEIPGNEIRYIDMILNFMKKADSSFHADVFNDILISVFHQISNESVNSTIERLANTVLNSPDGTINQFQIEDTLIACGMNIPREKSTFSVSVSEDQTTQKKADQTQDTSMDALLDSVLSRFIKSLNSSLSNEETEQSIVFLKDVFKKFNDKD